jgi:RimJ/RimL family protein N-acetyltransferase
MSPVPTLTTERLRLRAWRERDLEAYAAMCADEEVMRHIGAGGAVASDVAWRHMALFLGEWALHGHGMWALESRADGRLLGRVGFLDPPGWPGCELAWLLARDAWGQGYAFEAASAARDFGRDALGLARLVSLIRPGNTRSIRLAEKLGARAGNGGAPISFMGSPSLLYEHPAV